MTGSSSNFAAHLLAWFDRHRRDLPWRVPIGSPPSALPEPYHVLVSEAMLQQTQVATVVPYFRRFIERFPTLASLASAEEQDVLRLWQGLGYYSRARNLRRAAVAAIERHGGLLPMGVPELLKLPGVGRYTAGAIASLAFGQSAQILDGNVARVLCRIDCIRGDPRERSTAEVLWTRAAAVLPPNRPGDFNSAMMELGATVCIPRKPQCLICPVASSCDARAAGLQDVIPPPRQAKATPLVRRRIFLIEDAVGRLLLEQRPATGRWAGMWQFITAAGGRSAIAAANETLGGGMDAVQLIGQIDHALTHRRYAFRVYHCELKAPRADMRPRRWMTREEIDRVALPKPHLRAMTLLNG